jgi:flavodoxin
MEYMRKILSILGALLTGVCLSACGGKKQSEPYFEEDSAPKYLVLYYSQSGTTKQVAEELQQRLGADIEAIELVEPYNGDYSQTIERSLKERMEGTAPQVKPIHSKVGDYDAVFLGYPVWFGTYALPIAGLIQQESFEGVTIVPFCTFGSGGLESSAKDLQAALPHARVMDGYGVRSARLAAVPREVNRFLIERGYIEGEVKALPGFAEQQPVTDEEKAIFNAACGDYQFPLGTPLTVGKRGTDEGVDYEFTAAAKDVTSGEETQITVYVTVPNGEGAKPEFTRVVR